MNRRLSRFGWIGVLMILSACGGSGPGSGLEVEPQEVRASETILLVGDFEEGDTVCFVRKEGGKAARGCGFPSVLEDLTETEEGRAQARVTVPGLILPGSYEVKVARGEEFGDGADLTVLPGAGDASKSSGGTVPEAKDGEVIVPEGTPPPNPYEDYANGGGSVDAPPAALSASLEGTEALHETSLGMVKINYRTTGALQALFIYGPFTPDSDCDDKLAIDPSGSDLNPGSPNFTKYQGQYSGEICDETLGNCPGYEPVPGVIQCRIDLSTAAGSFFVRMYRKESVYTLVAEGADGEEKIATKTLTAPTPSLSPEIRVMADAPEIAVEFSFANAAGTPSFTVEGCAADPSYSPVRSPDGHGFFRQRCPITKTETAISLSVPGIGSFASRTLKVVLGHPTARLNAGLPSNPDGRGEIRLKPGIERAYEVKEAATEEVLSSGTVPWVKSMTLAVRTSNGFMKEPKYGDLKTVEVTSAESAGAWFENVVRDYANTAWRLSLLDFDGRSYEAASTSVPYTPKFDVTPVGTDWDYDFDYDTCRVDNSYQNKGTASRRNPGTDSPRYGAGERSSLYQCCDPTTGEGCRHDSRNGVWNCRNYKAELKYMFTLRHVKSVEVRCNGRGEDGSFYDRSIDPNQTQPSSGPWWDVSVLLPNANPATDPYETSFITRTLRIPGEAAGCFFIAITHDNQWIPWKGGQAEEFTRPFTGYCDAPDRSGSDPDDTGI